MRIGEATTDGVCSGDITAQSIMENMARLTKDLDIHHAPSPFGTIDCPFITDCASIPIVLSFNFMALQHDWIYQYHPRYSTPWKPCSPRRKRKPRNHIYARYFQRPRKRKQT